MLTPEGFRKASSVWKTLEESERLAIIRMKEGYNFKSIDDLLDYVYTKFPKYAISSALKPEVIYSYFQNYFDENGLSEEYLMDAYNKYRS